VDFDARSIGANYIITGEGRFDSQSIKGKAPWGILQRVQRDGVPTFLVCGDADTQHASAFAGIYTLTSIESDIAQCINNPAPLVKELGSSIARLVEEL